jgi:putative ABC transport system permease protein
MKFAVRQLLKSPGFTVIAVVTLALGIGVNTTAFTVLNRLMLESLPFHDTSSLVQVWTNSLRYGRDATAPADYFDEREQNTVFADMAAYQPWRSMSYAEPGKSPVQVDAVYMTANFFSILGVSPELGRLPSAEESKTMAHVCLISDWFWRQHFNADPNVIGRVVRVNSRPSTVIGVMPPSIEDSDLFGNRPGFYYLDPVTHSRTYRAAGWYQVLARLKPGVSLAQAQAGMTVVAQRLAHDYPDTNKDRQLSVIPYPKNQFGDEASQLTWMTIALSGLVLLIACINLANLQLVRTTGRSHEVAIRLALGSSPRRVVGMFLTESVLVSLVGGALGIAVAVWSNAFVARFLGMDMPVDLRVIAFTFLASLATALLFGAAPAWLATRAPVGPNLKSSGRGSTSDRSRHWLRQGLVLLELAMALTLLAGAGFFVSGLYRLTHRDLGWEGIHEAFGVVALDQDHFGGEKNRDKVIAFSAQALEALRALPGVDYASLSDEPPSWGGRTAPYQVDGRPPVEKGREPLAGFCAVSPGWLEVFGIRLVEGRAFTEADRQDSRPVAIVDESMARALWPGESAIGKRIGDLSSEKLVWAEVVGVIKDFRGGSEFFNPTMNAFRFLRPWSQYSGNGTVVFSVRTQGPPGPIKDSLRKTMGVLLPDLALNELSTVEESTAGTYSFFTFLRRILVHIGVLGLLLSAIGIYGVVANLATERTKEIGIRMALGAQPGGILWMFVRNGLVLACAGAALGLVGALAIVTILGRILPYLPGRNPGVIAGAAAVLIIIALLACWLPARRTTKVSPMQALRVE